jgi:hypothetical protein
MQIVPGQSAVQKIELDLMELEECQLRPKPQMLASELIEMKFVFKAVIIIITLTANCEKCCRMRMKSRRKTQTSPAELKTF